MADLRLDEHGAQRCSAVAQHMLPALLAATEEFPPAAAGVRLHGLAWLSELLKAGGVIGQLIAEIAGADYQPVRAIYFDKNATTNWALGLHQDRTIAVRGSAVPAGFSLPTTKQGISHLQPPFGITEKMLTVRIHLDPVDEHNAPLLIVPGSHRGGLIEAKHIHSIAETKGIIACLAEAGDVWVYKTAILHGSERAKGRQRRRVIQADYSEDVLPTGLEWFGIA